MVDEGDSPFDKREALERVASAGGYTVDAEGLIVSVEDGWDAFALANGGEAGLAAAVLGRHWGDFVADERTRSYMDALFFACRASDEEIAINYRCDSPGQMRYFRMDFRPNSEGRVTTTHSLLGEAPKKSVQLTTKITAQQCTQCLKFSVADTWIDAFRHPETDFSVSAQTICPACREMGEDAIKGYLRSAEIIPFNRRF